MNMTTKQAEGCMFRFTQLAESNKENDFIKCNAAFTTKKGKHLGYMKIL